MGKIATLEARIERMRERGEETAKRRKAEVLRLKVLIARAEKSEAAAWAKYEDCAERNRRHIHNNKNYLYKLRQQRKQNKAVAARAREFEKRVERQTEYLVKDLGMGKDFNENQVRELILRAVVTYEGLVRSQVVSFDEVMYLLVGSQVSAFDLDDVKSRAPHLSGRYKVRFGELVEAGLIAKVYRKPKYYLTGLGKQRLNDILKYIYENKIGTYKLLSRVFKIEEN